MIKRLCEYGSEFDWNSNSPYLMTTDNLLFREHLYWYRSGRDALKSVATYHSNQYCMVMLPALCCESMVRPFMQNGYTPVFYQLTEQLTADLNDIKRKVSEKCILVYMNYFGIKAIYDKELTLLREQFPSVIFLEDRTHDWLEKRKDKAFVADYTIASVRKWLAVPDAAYLSTKTSWTTCELVETQFAQMREEALKQKSQYLAIGDATLKNQFIETLKEASNKLDDATPPYAMTALSRRILSVINFSKIANVRKRNTLALKECLAEARQNDLLSLITEYPENSALYFPILVNNRDSIQAVLAKQSIYCPVIWPVPKEAEECCPVAESVAERMLGIPCDQRYSVKDIEYIGQAVVNAIHCAGVAG